MGKYNSGLLFGVGRLSWGLLAPLQICKAEPYFEPEHLDSAACGTSRCFFQRRWKLLPVLLKSLVSMSTARHPLAMALSFPVSPFSLPFKCSCCEHTALLLWSHGHLSSCSPTSAVLWSPGSCNDVTARSACSQWWELRTGQLLCTESQIHHNGPALWRV